MPPAEVQSKYVGSSGVEAFKETALFWNLTRNAMAETGNGIHAGTRVVDVGVGWGRTYRWMLRDLEARNIRGLDVDIAAVDMCRTAMPDGDFRHISPSDAYPVDGGLFDLALYYSVFSHLSEAAARGALEHARQALNPNGLVALTTLRMAHIDLWDRHRSEGRYLDALNACQFDRVEWWERAAEGQHLYVPTGGGDPSRPAETYGEAVVPKGWWETVDGYRLLKFERLTGLPQVYVVLQKV
ncbi:class I SAM-dependent methyltransferase [uncultured Enterovirga sp.]|uniref:class I SAM-dependent methyltransferase n=1 Tax=uncultured Enterovirga sp. TaxID=2026352 RepID=UPI0035C94834